MNLKLIIYLALIVTFFSSCEFDNYDSPGYFLEGKLVYNGTPIGVGKDAVNFKLYETPAWDENKPIVVDVSQDGSYSALLFGANYKVQFEDNQGPFLKPDSIIIDLSSSKSLDIEVQPYYLVNNPECSVSGINLIANFSINKIVTGANSKDIEYVGVFVNKTKFVDKNSLITASTSAGNPTDLGNISMEVNLIPYANMARDQDYLYARAGVKVAGVEDLIYSEVQKVDGIPTSIELEDVTSQYLTNYEMEFEIEPWFDARRGKVVGWSVSPLVEYTMYDDGWGHSRRWMAAENWGGADGAELVKGGVWQSFTLPAGKYVFEATRRNSWDLNGGEDRAYVAFAQGSTLDWDSNFIVKGDCAQGKNSDVVLLSFELASSTEVSCGYVVNFPDSENNAVMFSKFKLSLVK